MVTTVARIGSLILALVYIIGTLPHAGGGHARLLDAASSHATHIIHGDADVAHAGHGMDHGGGDHGGTSMLGCGIVCAGAPAFAALASVRDSGLARYAAPHHSRHRITVPGLDPPPPRRLS